MESWAQASAHPAAHRSSTAEQLFSNEFQVDALVQSLPSSFPRGLLVLHEPSDTGALFLAGTHPKCLPWHEACALLPERLPAALLYSERTGASVGHFERLLVHLTPPVDRGATTANATSSIARPASCLLVPPMRGGCEHG